jgi:ADP-ribose pyrophosphatase
MQGHRRVSVQARKRLFDDVFKIDEVIVAHELNDGAMSAAQRRLVFERGDSAAVLLFNRDRKCLVLVKQFRAATLGKSREHGWVAECVAGIIDENETPTAAAIRETREETGYRITDLQPIATFFSSPGGTSERIFLYYAETTDADRIGHSAADTDEDLETCHVSVAEVFAQLQSGFLEDAKLIIGVLWLRANRSGSEQPGWRWS